MYGAVVATPQPSTRRANVRFPTCWAPTISTRCPTDDAVDAAIEPAAFAESSKSYQIDDGDVVAAVVVVASGTVMMEKTKTFI